MAYVWLKAVHVASVLLFAGGLLMQTLAVAAAGRGEHAISGMVARWDKRVTLPALLGTWLSGALVAAAGGWLPGRWLWAKLVLVFLLSGLHGLQAGLLGRLERDEKLPPKSPASPGPGFVALVLICIALLAVAKPF